MSRKEKTHLRGERGQTFADKVRGLNLEQILCVSLDISKYFQLVMSHLIFMWSEIITLPNSGCSQLGCKIVVGLSEKN